MIPKVRPWPDSRRGREVAPVAAGKEVVGPVEEERAVDITGACVAERMQRHGHG